MCSIEQIQTSLFQGLLLLLEQLMLLRLQRLLRVLFDLDRLYLLVLHRYYLGLPFLKERLSQQYLFSDLLGKTGRTEDSRPHRVSIDTLVMILRDKFVQIYQEVWRNLSWIV